MSVLEKSWPLQRTGCSVDLARAYTQQSPRFNPAGCLPFPKSRQDSRERAAWARSNGATRTAAARSQRSRSAPPSGLYRASITMPASTTLTTDVSLTSSAAIAAVNASRSGSPVRIAIIADVSSITAVDRCGRIQESRWRTWNPARFWRRIAPQPVACDRCLSTWSFVPASDPVAPATHYARLHPGFRPTTPEQSAEYPRL